MAANNAEVEGQATTYQRLRYNLGQQLGEAGSRAPLT